MSRSRKGILNSAGSYRDSAPSLGSPLFALQAFRYLCEPRPENSIEARIASASGFSASPAELS